MATRGRRELASENPREGASDPSLGKGGKPEFAPGEVVRLKSGGPLMTVTGTRKKPGLAVEVWWFAAGDETCPRSDAFPPAALEAAKS